MEDETSGHKAVKLPYRLSRAQKLAIATGSLTMGQVKEAEAIIPLSCGRKIPIEIPVEQHVPGAYDLADPVPGTIPTGLPPYDYEVKSWPQFFEPMVAHKKLHDMRNKRDRDYKVGDRMLLREFDPFGGGYTGRCAVAYISYITDNETPCALSSVGLGDDMAILSVRVSGPYPDDDRWA